MRTLSDRLIGSGADTDALARVAHGDIDALGDVYDRHARALLQFVTRVIGNSDAQDVVHATFLRAARVAATYDGRSSSARAWLIGIATRIVRERRRSLARATRALLSFAGSRSTSPAEPAPDEHRSRLAAALDTLTLAKRTVVVLADVEGFTAEEIARILVVPVGTVYTRLHHARRELRALLEDSP